MKHSLQGKLILSYLAIAFITVLVVFALLWFSSSQSLMNLVAEQQTANLKQTVQDYYASNGSLDGFFDYFVRFNRKDEPPPQPIDSQGKPPPSRDLRGVYGLVDTQYSAILPMAGYQIGQTVPADQFKHAIPVEVDGETIAWILPDTSLQFKLSAE